MGIQRVAGIILAAGASRRMGGTPKALLPIHGVSFVLHILKQLADAGATPVIVVTAPATESAIREALSAVAPGQMPLVAVNPHPDHGQLSSLLAGLEAAASMPVDGVIVCPVDIPLFHTTTAARLIDTFRSTGALIVRPSSQGRHGHPVVFSRQIFDDFREADPAIGARSVVRAHAARCVDVRVDDAGALVDIDTPDDYRHHVGTLPDPDQV